MLCVYSIIFAVKSFMENQVKNKNKKNTNIS